MDKNKLKQILLTRDKKKLLEILLTLALFLDAITAVSEFYKDEETNLIEENLAYALDQNIIATRYFEKVEVDAIDLIDAHLSYINKEISKKFFENKIAKFTNNSINISHEYNDSLKNASNLRGRITESIDNREKYRKVTPVIIILSIFLLLIAIALTFLQDEDIKNLLFEIKEDNGKVTVSIKELNDLLRDHNEIIQAHALYSKGRYEEALHAYDMALNINPNNANTWTSKGIVLESLGRTAEAKFALTKAKELNLQDDSG
jgi:tetratricopeptide (TPR) repeat protein